MARSPRLPSPTWKDCPAEATAVVARGRQISLVFSRSRAVLHAKRRERRSHPLSTSAWAAPRCRVLGDPVFQLLPIDRRELRAVGTKPGGVLDVDVHDLVRPACRCSSAEARGCSGAASRARPTRGRTSAPRRSSPTAAPPRPETPRPGRWWSKRSRWNVLRPDAVLADHQGQQLAGGLQYLLGAVVVGGRGAAYSSARHGWLPSGRHGAGAQQPPN